MGLEPKIVQFSARQLPLGPWTGSLTSLFELKRTMASKRAKIFAAALGVDRLYLECGRSRSHQRAHCPATREPKGGVLWCAIPAA